ncbi:MAG: hypothetical protein KY460_14010 [Actinobacteria bacterium]|nr:hypothetical protein [Actinomycetota bacterium]
MAAPGLPGSLRVSFHSTSSKGTTRLLSRVVHVDELDLERLEEEAVRVERMVRAGEARHFPDPNITDLCIRCVGRRDRRERQRHAISALGEERDITLAVWWRVAEHRRDDLGAGSAPIIPISTVSSAISTAHRPVVRLVCS